MTVAYWAVSPEPQTQATVLFPLVTLIVDLYLRCLLFVDLPQWRDLTPTWPVTWLTLLALIERLVTGGLNMCIIVVPIVIGGRGDGGMVAWIIVGGGDIQTGP